MTIQGLFKTKNIHKFTSLGLVTLILSNLFVGLTPLLVTEVKADSFYPSGDGQYCNFGMATSVSYRNLPSNSTAPGGMSYNTGDVYGESGNYPESHRITDVANLLYPDARRYRGVADRIAVPPNTRVDVGFYVHNYSGHTITAHNGYLFLSRANTDLGDWGRLGSGGSYGSANFQFFGRDITRSGRMIQTGNIGTYGVNSVSNPPLGRTIHSFTTIQPMQIQSRTATPEFLGGGNLRIRYDLTVRNISQYNLANIRVTDDLPSGETFDQTVSFNAGQTRTFTYYANMGSSYPTNITNSPARVQDPNRHKEEAAIGNNELTSFNPESRTIIVDRDDAGAPAGWRGRQPDFSANPAGDYFLIELLPYTIRSNDTTVNVPPNLLIEKVVSDDDESQVKVNSSSPNEVITYDINVRNTGGNATGVVVVDDYDQSLISIIDADGGNDDGDSITWNIGNLNNQETRTFTISARVTEPLAHGTYEAPNTVTVDSDQTNPRSDNTLTNITAEVRMAIDKRVTDSDETDVNANHIQGAHPIQQERNMQYTIQIENSGNADATGVSIVDDVSEVIRNGRITSISDGGILTTSGTGASLTGEIVWDIGNLAQGESRSVTFNVEMNAGITDETQINNIAEVITNEVPPISDTTITTIHSPILEVVKDDGIENGEPGQDVHWVLNVRNVGTGNAYNVAVFDFVPERMTVLNISDDGAWSANSRTIIWSKSAPQHILNGSYDPDPRSEWGESKSLSYSVLLDEIFPVGTTELENIVVAQTSFYPPIQNEHVLPVTALPNNEIIKYVVNETATDEGREYSGEAVDHENYGADANDQFNNIDDVYAIAGDVIKYTLTFRNTGNAHSPETTVSDHIPRYITDKDGNQFEIVLLENIFDVSEDIEVVATPSGYDVIWNVGELQVGDEWHVREFRVRINPDSTVTLSSDSQQRLLDNVSVIDSEHPEVESREDNAILQVNQPNAEITKEADKLEYQSDEEVIYSISVTNSGSSIATGTVTDILPQGLEFVSTDFQGEYRLNGQEIKFDVVLEAGATLDILVTVRFTSPVIDLTEFNNEVSYEYIDANGNQRPTVEDQVEILVHAPILELEKVQNLPEVVAPGQPIIYTLNFRNIGSGYSPNTTLTDQIPEHTLFVEFVETDDGFEGVFDFEKNSVSWNLGTLEPNFEGSVSFKVVIEIPTPSGTEIRNTAVIYTPVLDEISSEVVTAIADSCCLSGQIWDDANRNGIFDERENPIEGAKVRVRWNESEYLPENESVIYTDQNGIYTQLGLPYHTVLTISVDIPEGFDEITTEREFRVVLLPLRDDGVREDYVVDGIRYVTADDCMNFLNAGIYRDIIFAQTGQSIVLGLITGLGLISIGLGGIILLISRKKKNK